ncbi:MAG: UvrD-helicase domain-containing protein [Clostridia bacterium]|nr:UvrD-helicase domain-containing protein [Clostridia bacterium]
MTHLDSLYLTYKQALFDKAYEHLNPMQREAVFSIDHPLLVLAGAGSGKTTVLVQRIAFLIHYGNAYFDEHVPAGVSETLVEQLKSALDLPAETIRERFLPMFSADPCPAFRVLAITFTNKAANEIKNRLAATLPESSGVADIWAGTFHSICARILRSHGDLMGYAPGFTIYDTDDQKKTIAEALKVCNLDEKLLPIKTIQGIISRAKDHLMTPDDYLAEAKDNLRMKQVGRVYEAYQGLLRSSNALDFDDLIMQTVLLLKTHKEVRELYQNRFRYVSVDEFQETNPAQLELTVLLSGGYRNLMVVGDDDQSIYRFRGATIENILSFDRLFPDAKVVKLEQNYRSTSVILAAANAVIAHNEGRHEKKLWTAADEGEKITLHIAEDQNAEARYIVDTVQKEVARGNAAYKDFAVLYRTNAQANSIEKALARAALPYRILGGIRFSDRKEIRDAVAYLQLIANHADNLRLNRIINEPKRKIGAKTLEAIAMIAVEQGLSQFEVMETADKYVALERTKETLLSFANMINDLTALSKKLSLDALFDEVMDRSGYRQMLKDGGEPEAERLDNLEEFKSNILEYVKEAEEPTLTGFLEETALVADVDRYDESADALVLMTIHSAKGLEFPRVFLPGMEEGLFPSPQAAMEGPAELEEERRLCYVALTRAKKKLYLISAKTRLLYGRTLANPISRFVEEIPEGLLKKELLPSQRTSSYTGAFAKGHSETSFSSFGKATVGTNIFEKKSAPKEQLSPGDRVLHATFGEGQILSVKPMGADLLYEVLFERVGIKKMMATYAKLKKL